MRGRVAFYRRYNWRVNPDVVVLTFHNNDLDFYPMVYKARSGIVFWYLGLRDKVAISETLGDTWHPSDAIAAYFASYLKARHFLN